MRTCFDWYFWEDDKNVTPRSVMDTFQTFAMQPTDMELIVACYITGSYDGQAIVVYRDKRDGKVYEVNGSHCSCYGLEGQWAPEEVVVDELVERPSYLYHEDKLNEEIRHALFMTLVEGK